MPILIEGIMRTLALICALLGARCGDTDTRYEIDGVPVVVEDDRGPTEEDMRLAVEAYRFGGFRHYAIHPARDIAVWRSLREIRWVDHALPEWVTYDHRARVVRVTWPGCAISEPLYVGLTYHYASRLYETAEPSPEHVAWARDQAQSLGDFLCP
jgi:hypothetical protein